jgi:photosystem II stability/assembly factor-like uncharacterized protein
MKQVARFSALAASFLLLVASHAQEFDSLRWRNIGPKRGGRSLAVAGSVKRPLEYYFGATGGGLWKTTDSGTTWEPVTDGQLHSSSVGAVAVSESNPDVVYLGMGETELRASILEGDGMYKSTDDGKTWRHIGLDDTRTISRIRVDPRNPDIVYVAALGHPYAPNEQRGVFRSRDGGATWERVLFRSNLAGAVDLAMDPHDPNVLYASLWEVYRKPWLLSSGGPHSGLFKSTDGGSTWKDISRAPGMPQGLLGKICVGVSAADSRRVYATMEADDGGLFRSDDAGATWTKVNEDRKIRQRAFYFSRTYADPRDRDTVYVLNVEFYRSKDGGKTFQTLHTPHADHHDLWIAPDNPLRMAAADDGGGAVSLNGGKTWTNHEYATAQFYHVATTRDIPYHVCGAQQDDGTACVPSSAGLLPQEEEGGPREIVYSVGGGEAAYIAPGPVNPNIFFSGTQAGLMTRFDRSSGEIREITVDPLFFSGMPAKDLRERWQWVFPIVFSPFDPTVLYASSQHLWRSTNEGQSWQRISPDLTRADPTTLGDSGGPITKDQNGPEIYATIFSIAPSRKEANTIWTGSDDGIVSITRDGGKNWSKITPPELPEFSRVSMIDASPHQPGGAYLAAKRYELDDREPLAYKTADYGKTWTRIINGIGATDFVHVVREDPKRPGLLYAGTEHGVYVSFDDGAAWRSFSLNLPDTPVVDLVVEGGDLVIATHGRSFWVLDNIGILREWTPQISRAPVRLFSPQVAIRAVRPATIDFWLAKDSTDGSVEILAPGGNVVKRIRCVPASAKSEDARPPRDTMRCRAGTNRLVWDLTYPGPVTFPGLILRYASPNDGPPAPPGTYQVRLTAAGQTETRPFEIQRDPRVPGVTDADLEKQFQLAIKIRDSLSRANQMVVAIREIMAQINERKKQVHDPAILTSADKMEGKLKEVEETIYQVRNRSPRDTLNYPIKLNNQLAVLQRGVSMGDYPPTDQDAVVYEQLSEKLNRLRDAFETTLGADLKRLNDAFGAHGVPPVAIPGVTP